MMPCDAATDDHRKRAAAPSRARVLMIGTDSARVNENSFQIAPIEPMSEKISDKY